MWVKGLLEHRFDGSQGRARSAGLSILILSFGLFPVAGWTWGDDGHEIVAAMLPDFLNAIGQQPSSGPKNFSTVMFRMTSRHASQMRRFSRQPASLSRERNS
jgi:hypothetical protein